MSPAARPRPVLLAAALASAADPAELVGVEAQLVGERVRYQVAGFRPGPGGKLLVDLAAWGAGSNAARLPGVDPAWVVVARDGQRPQGCPGASAEA